MRYMIWNNKGGVGKTFLTFSLATEYALKHPEKHIAVIDMCPQANISEMLLGGNGKGERNLAKQAERQKTIAAYIKDRYANKRIGLLGTEHGYYLRAHDVNPEMPENLFILPGDVDLDICSGLITYMGNAPERNAWKTSRNLLDDIICAFENEHKNTVVFIDCNPSFAVYTEMAAVSARRLIIPCTADNASIRGILNLFRLIYGADAYKIAGIDQHIDNTFFTFSEKAKDAGFNLPTVRMVILNKSRSLDANATKAWTAHKDKITSIMGSIQSQLSSLFCPSIERLIYDVKDGNTLATIVNHTGTPISKIKSGSYDIYGTATMANATQVNAIMEQISPIVNALL